MEISFLIVTKNRPEELQFTLKQLHGFYDAAYHEVLVFIDGCKATEALQSQFDWVKWTVSPTSISASPARKFLYSKASGTIFIGLDDDAHLVSKNPIQTIQHYFNQNPNLGILAFLELKGVFENPIIDYNPAEKEAFLTTDFIGCGFAILKRAYNQTSGFPDWIDIYGEEPCLSIEVMDLKFDIMFTNQVAVNHRVDVLRRKNEGKNYFRFEKQLQNSFRIYVVYYQNPFPKIIRLLWHNFKKYAVSDTTYFKLYCKAVCNMIMTFPMVFKRRKSMTALTAHKLKTLKRIQY